MILTRKHKHTTIIAFFMTMSVSNSEGKTGHPKREKNHDESQVMANLLKFKVIKILLNFIAGDCRQLFFDQLEKPLSLCFMAHNYYDFLY